MESQRSSEKTYIDTRINLILLAVFGTYSYINLKRKQIPSTNSLRKNQNILVQPTVFLSICISYRSALNLIYLLCDKIIC